MDEKTHIVTSEVADHEFTRFADLMDLDVDTKDMDAEDQEDFTKQKKRITRAIEKGALTLNEEGEFTFTPQRSEQTEPITFYKPTGASIMAMDRRKKNEDIAKMFAMMGSMTRTNAATFSRMALADLKVCQSITMFFLV